MAQTAFDHALADLAEAFGDYSEAELQTFLDATPTEPRIAAYPIGAVMPDWLSASSPRSTRNLSRDSGGAGVTLGGLGRFSSAGGRSVLRGVGHGQAVGQLDDEQRLEGAQEQENGEPSGEHEGLRVCGRMLQCDESEIVRTFWNMKYKIPDADMRHAHVMPPRVCARAGVSRQSS